KAGIVQERAHLRGERGIYTLDQRLLPRLVAGCEVRPYDPPEKRRKLVLLSHAAIDVRHHALQQIPARQRRRRQRGGRGRRGGRRGGHGRLLATAASQLPRRPLERRVVRQPLTQLAQRTEQ